MRIFRGILLSLLVTVAGSAETIRVGAAISLKAVITEIATTYEKTTGDRVEFVFGSSGQILAQIKSGAEIDLFVSAANAQVEELIKAERVDPASRRVIAMNRLVLVVPAGAKESPGSFRALAEANVGRVAVGEPKTVPAGQYARQVFATLGLESALADKLVYGTNVRQVLTYVERGEVAAGVVYSTDAIEAGDKVRVVATADEKWHDPIVYPGVLVTASAKKHAAARFLTYLSRPDAQAIFIARGFALPEATTTRPASP